MPLSLMSIRFFFNAGFCILLNRLGLAFLSRSCHSRASGNLHKILQNSNLTSIRSFFIKEEGLCY